MKFKWVRDISGFSHLYDVVGEEISVLHEVWDPSFNSWHSARLAVIFELCFWIGDSGGVTRDSFPVSELRTPTSTEPIQNYRLL